MAAGPTERKHDAKDGDQEGGEGATVSSRRDSMKDNRSLSAQFEELVEEKVFEDDSSVEAGPEMYVERGRQRQRQNDRSKAELFLLIDTKAGQDEEESGTASTSPRKKKNSYHRERRERSTAELRLLIDKEADQAKAKQNEMKSGNARMKRDLSPNEVEFLNECRARKSDDDKDSHARRIASESNIALMVGSQGKDERYMKLVREEGGLLDHVDLSLREEEDAFQSAIDMEVDKALSERPSPPRGGRQLYKERSRNELKLLESVRNKKGRGPRRATHKFYNSM